MGSKKISHSYLLKFLAENSHAIAGIAKAIGLWDTIWDSMTSLTPLTQQEAQNRPDVINNAMLYKNKFRYFIHDDWVHISDVLKNCNALYRHKRKTLSDDLITKLNASFGDLVKYQSLVSSMLKLLTLSEKDAANYLTQIFSEEFANILHKNKDDIRFNSLANNIGKTLCHFICHHIEWKSTTDARCHPIPFMQDVLKEKLIFNAFYDRHDDKKDIRLMFFHSETHQKDMTLIKLFTAHTQFIDERYYFNHKDLIYLIKIFMLKTAIVACNAILQSLSITNKPESKELVDTHTTTVVEDFGAFFYARQNDMSDRHYFSALVQKLENVISTAYIGIGAEILCHLENNIIHIGSIIGDSERTPYNVRLINEDYYLELPSDFPVVYFTRRKLKEIGDQIPPNRPINLHFLRKVNSDVSQKYYITGSINDADIFDNNAKTNKFTINTECTYDFFSALFAAQECYNKIYNYYKNNDPIFYTVIIKEELQKILAFVGQIFEINFMELWNTCPIAIQPTLLNMIEHALNFNTAKKFKVNYNVVETAKKLYTEYPIYANTKEDTSSIHSYSTYLKGLIDVIYSKKIMLNDIFYQIYIMLHFKYYHYTWFADSRGRKQLLSLLSPQNMAILRFFISFYGCPTITECVTDIMDRKSYHNYPGLFEEQKDLSYHQAVTNYHKDVLKRTVEKLRDYTPYVNNIWDIFSICMEVSISKGFLYYALNLDYVNLKHNINYRCRHTMGYDFKNSGLQIQSIFFRSLMLARNCNLVANSIDIYSAGEKALNVCIDDFIAFYDALDPNLSDYFNKKQINVEAYNRHNFDITNLKLPYYSILKTSPLNIMLQNPLLTFNETWHDIINYTDLGKLFKTKFIRENLITRKVMKVLCMTTPYGSTASSAVKQVLKTFLKTCRKKGIWLSKDLIKAIDKVAQPIYKLFLYWFTETLPDALLLRLSVRKFYKKKKVYQSIQFKNPYFSFFMYPLLQKTKKIRISSGRKARIKRVQLKLTTNMADFKKVRNALPANWMQSGDAVVVSVFNSIIYNENTRNDNFDYMAFSNHDCFYTSPVHSPRLKQDLKICYQDVYLMNLLKTFAGYPAYYHYLQKYCKARPELKLEDLCPDENFAS